MLTVTSAALSCFADILADNEDDGALRIALVEESLGLVPDEVRAGDATFEHDGRVVLVLDEEISDLLADRTLDVEGSDQGARLTIR